MSAITSSILNSNILAMFYALKPMIPYLYSVSVIVLKISSSPSANTFI